MRRFAAVIWTITTAVVLQGCGGDCATLKKERDALIETRNPFAKLPTDDTTHFGVTFKDTFLDEVVAKALTKSLESAMKLGTNIKIGSSQSIKVTTLPNVTDVSIRADAACDHCVRIMSKVDGKVTVTVPIIGKQSVPLSGNLSLVAPLVFESGDDKDAAVKVDVAEAGKLGKSKMETSLRQLPPTWSNALRSPLADAMLEAVIENVKPVTIFEFDAPDFGIDGLKVRPSKLVTDAKNKTIYVGLATNLAGVEPGQGIAPLTRLSSNKNLAFGVHPAVLSSATNALMKSGKVSRTYDKDGNEAAGPMSVLLSSIEVGTAKDKATPVKTKFRLWNLPTSGKCYWVDVDATADMTVKDDKLQLAIGGFEVTDSSLPGIVVKLATWVNSGFWKSQKKVIEAGVSEDGLELPGKMKLDTKPTSVLFQGNALWVTTNSTIK